MVTTGAISYNSRLGGFLTSSGPAANLRVLGAGMVGGGAALAALPEFDLVLCPLRAITGVPCPFCGMTTGTLALARADLGSSVSANPAAIVLVAAVLLAFLPESARERGLIPLGRAARRVPPWLPWVALIPLWIWQLARFDLI